MSVIRTEKLTKFYGDDRGIIDLDLTVGAGEVFGFLGPNGAGKSTTIRLLLDLIRPSSGRIEALRCRATTLRGAAPPRRLPARRPPSLREPERAGDVRLLRRAFAG